eukprot:maker-scaffold1343_size46188-snap-gene-0.9 protein:Tk02719 transcript:maker-scaffold1343_size46188-snap-gene-0.9-mRNA-1 annotation:"lactosylceramide 4-alpha-galactosyltransferase"
MIRKPKVTTCGIILLLCSTFWFHWLGLLSSPTVWMNEVKIPQKAQQLNRSRAISEIFPEQIPNNSAIFFFETNVNRKALSYMDYCAYESAARYNPDTKVFLLIDKRNSRIKTAPSLVNRYPNIHVHSLNVTRLLLSSPLSNNIRDVFWHLGSSMMHMGDILRTLILYIKGGIYLDSDVITVAQYPMEDSLNYGALNFESRLNPAVMKYMAQHPFLEMVVKAMPRAMKNHDFGSVGPLLITRLIEENCAVQNPKTKRKDPEKDKDLSRPLSTNPLLNYTFICPPEWNLKIFSVHDKAVLHRTEWVQELGIPPKGQAEYPNLLGLHLHDFPNELHTKAKQLLAIPGIKLIMETYCPLTAEATIQSVGFLSVAPISISTIPIARGP